MLEDTPSLQRWVSDHAIRRNLNINHPMLGLEEEDFIMSLKNNRSKVVLGICLLDGTLIGIVSLENINYVDGTATTGSFIGDEYNHRQGYGTEAKMLILSYAFLTLNLRKICSTAKAFNRKSIDMNTRCGYKEEGRRVAQHYVDGEYCDEVFLAVFKENWLPLWERFQKEGRL